MSRAPHPQRCDNCLAPDKSKPCPAWQELIQEGGNGEPSKPVSGCLLRLMPWLISSAIRQSNIAAAEASAARREVEAVRTDIVTGLRRLAVASMMAGGATLGQATEIEGAVRVALPATPPALPEDTQ